MTNSQNKTKPTTQSVEDFINSYPNPALTQDYITLDKLFQKITGSKPVLWGRIVGYGMYRYTYPTGHSGTSMIAGFAPSKAGVTVYFVPGFDEMDELKAKLGYHRSGKSCLYLQHLGRIDLEVLEEMIKKSVEYVQNNYETED
jgi:Domain of unknown function (DU1801)